MLTSFGAWRERLAADGWWLDPLPDNPDLGAFYPWPTVVAHSMTRSHRHAVDRALRVIEEAAGWDERWHANLSGGKDSTALALLCAEAGWKIPALSARDDLCWPGEETYLRRLADRAGLRLRWVVVPERLQDLARQHPGSLGEDMEARNSTLGGCWYRALEADAKAEGVTGNVWGVRAGENKGRLANYVRRGALYRREDGRANCAPLSTWTALDVHAYLAAAGVPLQATYQCVDPGADALAMRHSWWAYGGRGAHHHYRWLRRWWPALWDLATEIDPGVAGLGL